MIDIDVVSRTVSDDKDVTISVEMASEIAFERAYGMSVFKMLQDPYAEHFAYLAWHGRRRLGESLPDFEKWQDTLSYCDVVADDGDADDPTPV